MTRGSRLAVIGLVGLALLTATALVVFASGACPQELPGQSCPDAGRNQAIVIALAAIAAALLGIPFAFLAEFAFRRGIAFRGAWARALRRGTLLGALIAVAGGLRLGNALSPPAVLFILLIAGVVEWFGIRSLDSA